MNTAGCGGAPTGSTAGQGEEAVALPLGPLLELLRAEQFPVGSDSYVRVHLLLARLDLPALLDDHPEADWDRVLRDRLCVLLRPLLATTPDQQRRFDALFDRYWEGEAPDFRAAPQRDTAGVVASSEDATGLGSASPEALTALDLFLKSSRTRREAETRRKAEEALRLEAEERTRQERERVRQEAEQLQREQERIAWEATARRQRWWRRLGFTAAGLGCLAFLILGLLWLGRAEYSLDPADRVELPPVAASPGQAAASASTSIRLVRKEPGVPGLRRYLGRLLPPPKVDVEPGTAQVSPAHPADVPSTTLQVSLSLPAQGGADAHLQVHSSGPFDPPTPGLTVHASRPSATYRIRTAKGLTPSQITFPPIPASPASRPAMQQVAPQVETTEGTTGSGAELVLEEASGKPVDPSRLQVSGEGSAFHIEPPPVAKPARRFQFHVAFRPPSNRNEPYTGELAYSLHQDELSDPVTIQLRGSTPPVSTPPEARVAIEAAPKPPQRLPLHRPLPGWAILLASLGAAGLTALLAELLRRSQRMPPAEKPVPPFDYPLFPEWEDGPFTGAALGEAVRLLAPTTPREEAQSELDVDATVRATAHRAGFAVPVVRPPAWQPAYLALVEEDRGGDQLAAYYLALLHALRDRGLPLEIFTYHRDLRYCRREAKREGTRGTALDLKELKRLYPHRRILVFGQGASLVEAGSWRLTRSARELSDWPSEDGPPIWGLFTPQDPARPGLTGLAVGNALSWDRFGVFPATLRGLSQFGRTFGIGGRHRVLGRPEEETSLRPEVPPPAEVIGTDAHLGGLRAFLGDELLFQWLCACTLYPRCSFDLTLLLGLHLQQRFGGGQREPLVTERNLLRLLAIPWFREGEIAETVRLELQLRMDPAVAAAARLRLAELMERPPFPPEGSVAHARVQLEQRVQRWLADQSDAVNAKALRELVRRLPAYVLEAHPVLLSLLEERGIDLWTDAPPLQRRWMHWRYRLGIPHGSYRLPLPRWLAPSLAAATAVVVFAFVPVLRQDRLLPPEPKPLQPSPAAFAFKPLSLGATPTVKLVVTNRWEKNPVRVTLERPLPASDRGARYGPAERAPREASLNASGSETEVAPGATTSVSLPLTLADVKPGNSLRVTVRPLGPAETELPKGTQSISIPMQLVPSGERKLTPPKPLVFQPGKPAPAGNAFLRDTGFPPKVAPFLRLEWPDPNDRSSMPFQVDVPNEEGNPRAIRVTYAPRNPLPPGTVQKAQLIYEPAPGRRLTAAVVGQIADVRVSIVRADARQLPISSTELTVRIRLRLELDRMPNSQQMALLQPQQYQAVLSGKTLVREGRWRELDLTGNPILHGKNLQFDFRTGQVPAGNVYFHFRRRPLRRMRIESGSGNWTTVPLTIRQLGLDLGDSRFQSHNDRLIAELVLEAEKGSSIRLWDAESLDSLSVMHPDATLSPLKFSPSDRYLLTETGGSYADERKRQHFTTCRWYDLFDPKKSPCVRYLYG